MEFFSHNPFGVQKDLQRLLERQPSAIKITGSDSTFLLAGLLVTEGSFLREPTTLLVPSAKDARKLKDTLSQILPRETLFELPEFDVWPASGLYPSAQIAAARVGWCARLHQKEKGIYIATARSLAQWTTPQATLEKLIQHWRVGHDLPSHLREFLENLGYRSAPYVEDLGQYSLRGSILDIFCPYYDSPLRVELFGDTIESLRRFDPATQRSVETLQSCVLTPCQEIHWGSEHRMLASQKFKADLAERNLSDEQEATDYLQNLAQGQFFPGVEYLTSLFYERPGQPTDYLADLKTLWVVNPLEVIQTWDESLRQLRDEREKNPEAPLNIKPNHLIGSPQLTSVPAQLHIYFSKVDVLNEGGERDVDEEAHLQVSVSTPIVANPNVASQMERVREDLQAGFSVVIGLPSETHRQRIKPIVESLEIEPVHWVSEFPDLSQEGEALYILSQPMPESLRFHQDKILLLRSQDLFPRKRSESTAKAVTEGLQALSFDDLKVGDNVVHTLHGVGVFEGMKVMSLHGVEAEYLEIRYKDNDRLYLPIYRLNQLHKYGSKTKILDKLGGTGWAKTKSKVKNRLREMADELLKLYTLRKSAERPPLTQLDGDYATFVDEFPFEETEDQLKAIEDIQRDFAKTSPMDRLICGDVGFGKTEIAMRAAFTAASHGKQVAILAPTTVLTFQHYENFKTRFKNWPVRIALLNRFVAAKEARQTISDLAEGKVDIIIGTHKLLNSSIQFKNLGLLIIDEEQKFGVAHKERLRQLRTQVDTLCMSATPLPRTLNMSFIGMRDLSMINTAPLDRLPTRTFVTKFDPETVRRAILSEVERGGQVFYLHNRVQSIYSVADELRGLLPGVRLAVGHGQMEEKDLEKTMVAFFHREIDVLVCTTIIEAGMDVPNANTMFIDDAHRFGLSQLYQLRGRVGRSRKRAYCYLLIPSGRPLDKDAQERLRLIQEHTALGSGLIIAQHDLELRGAGTLLGEEQSGHIDSVGYEMFLELMEEAMQEAKGQEPEEKINPEINLKIPALIPRDYVPDLRVRLSLYRRLSLIERPEDVDKIEDDLRDQFGALPQEVINLMGIMLICAVCRELGIKDVSAGQKSISLSFSEKTRLNPSDVVALAMREKNKFKLTPDNRLNIKTDPKDWPTILEELMELKKLLVPERSSADTFVQS